MVYLLFYCLDRKAGPFYKCAYLIFRDPNNEEGWGFGYYNTFHGLVFDDEREVYN